MYNTNFKEQVASETLRLVSRFTLILTPVVITGLAQGFRHGFHENDYTFLVAGSLISIVCALGYGMVAVSRSFGNPKALWMYVAIWAGILPYLFSLYLFLFRGIWGFVNILGEFSAVSLISAISFTLIGYISLKRYAEITKLSKSVHQLALRESWWESLQGLNG